MSAMTGRVARLPWVTRMTEPVPCEGFMSHTPLKALYQMGGKPPVGLDRYRCRNVARWHFRALPDSGARDGDYCWPHLINRCLYGNEMEEARTSRALKAMQAADAALNHTSGEQRS